MTETLPRLLALQACDQRIREALHTLDSLRASLAALEEQALANARDVQVHRDKIGEAEQTRATLTVQHEQVKDQLRKKKRAEHRRRGGEIKENVSREVALLEARKAAVEEELHIVEAQVAANTAALHQAEEAAPPQAEERQRAATALVDQIAAPKEALRAAQEERTSLTAGITPFVLHEYERVFAHRGGVAVVAIEHETCQGCYMHVPAHLCLELQRTPKLAFCPNCRRIVFVAIEATTPRPHSHRPAASEHHPRRLQQRARVAASNGKTIPAAKTPPTLPVHV